MVPTWIVAEGTAFVIALGSFLFRPRDIPWAARLDRPKWLFFEPAIPLIWTAIFACAAWSASIVWDQEPGSVKTWFIMALYVLVEIVTVAYIPATLRLRSLAVGTFLGQSGVIFGVLLTLIVWPISGLAALLLLPYVLWSPIGTYATQRMIDLNPEAT